MAPIQLFKMASLKGKIDPHLSHESWVVDVGEVGCYNGWKILMRAPHITILELRWWLRRFMELKKDQGKVRQPRRTDFCKCAIKFLMPKVVGEDPIDFAPYSFVGPSEESA